jgi:ABC-type uncharacterized transport system auxiliary subunit
LLPVVALAAALASGCNIISTAVNLFKPPQKSAAEFTFPDDARIVVLIDTSDPTYDQPVFNEALYTRLAQYFRDNASKARLLPLDTVLRLKRANEDFERWSVQRVGREAEAEYVLQLRIRRLGVQESENYTAPVAQVEMSVKVIASNHPANDARVWPDSPDGRQVLHERRPGPHTTDSDPDTEMTKLARETAYYVMFPFFEVNVEEPPPVEK